MSYPRTCGQCHHFKKPVSSTETLQDAPRRRVSRTETSPSMCGLHGGMVQRRDPACTDFRES